MLSSYSKMKPFIDSEVITIGITEAHRVQQTILAQSLHFQIVKFTPEKQKGQENLMANNDNANMDKIHATL